MRLVVSIVVGLLAVGCATTPEQDRHDVCTALCKCVTTGPATLDRCITNDCLPVVASQPSDDCMQCIYLHSATCPDLINDCPDLCITSMPRFGGI